MHEVRAHNASRHTDWDDTPTIIGGRPAWHAHAACRGMDPELFFPERGVPTAATKKVCDGCPVKVPCREQGLLERQGIWGGTSERERRRERRRRARLWGPGVRASWTAADAVAAWHRAADADRLGVPTVSAVITALGMVNLGTLFEAVSEVLCDAGLPVRDGQQRGVG